MQKPICFICCFAAHNVVLDVTQKGQEVGLEGDPSLKQHFSQAPPRFTEAQLVKSLQERGIGRPSTYAPIISVLQVQ